MKGIGAMLAAGAVLLALAVGFGALRSRDGSAAPADVQAGDVSPAPTAAARDPVAGGQDQPAPPRPFPPLVAAPLPDPIVDPNVRPAAGLVTLPPALLAAVPNAAGDPQITGVAEKGATTFQDIANGLQLAPMSLPLAIQVTGNFLAGDQIQAVAKGDAGQFTSSSPATIPAGNAQTFTLTFDNFNKPGRYTITLNLTRTNATTAIDSKVVVITAKPLANVPKITNVVEVDTNSYPWVPAAATTKIRSLSCQVTVANLVAGQTVTLVNKDTGQPDPKVTAVTATDVTAVVSPTQLDPSGAVLAAQAQAGTIGKTTPSAEVVQVPTTSLPDPVIQELANNNYAPLAPPATGAVTVHDGYLHLKGGRGAPGGRIFFVVQDEQTTARAMRELPGTDVAVDASGGWEAVLNITQKLPSLVSNAQHKLWVRSEIDVRHRYAQAPLPFTIPASDPDLTKLTGLVLTTAGGKAVSQDPTTKQYWGGATKYQVQVSAGAATFDSTYILVSDLDGSPPGKLIGRAALTSGGPVPVNVEVTGEGHHRIVAALARGTTTGPPSDPIDLTVHAGGLRVTGVQPTNFGTAPGVQALTVQFSPTNRLSLAEAQTPTNYVLRRSMGTGAFDRGTDKDVTATFSAGNPIFDPVANTVVLKYNEPTVDVYQLEIKSAVVQPDGTLSAEGLRDIYGNPIEDDNGTPSRSYKIVLGKPSATGGFDGGDLPSVSRGITGQTGPYVPFPEYTPPRTPIDGVNPSDKVETRVVRLYYYRDAHRVAQIVNRNVKSYNYQAVEVRRRLADKARDEANKLTDDRRAQERQAVQAAQESREAEKALAQEQAALGQARQKSGQAAQDLTSQDRRIDQVKAYVSDAQTSQRTWQDRVTQLTQAGTTGPDLANAQKALAQATDAVNGGNTQLGLLTADRARLATAAGSATSDVTTEEGNVQAAQTAVQAKHNAEVAANEKSLGLAAQEDRSREEQFRREVAAAHEDPDTYAPGKPNSQDPVQQCSISVIGEGEIQLRGPVKGMNVIRTMINQIDAPVGQVRVAIHSAQVNGEHGDRMEKVVGRIQKYIDHSRFLTAQSAQMLRKAVVVVASRKAEEAAVSCPPGSQGARDVKYLYAFFGQDFIQELESLDSEFLKTGNKLLSLHSMDSTSLSSALFMLALAKNSTRQEILSEFERMIGNDLPAAEMTFIEEAGPDDDCKKFPLLAYNARFQSLRGFFDAEIRGDETMTPIQREFVRLAQIFKSHLVTELEYNQRVMERTIIEERFGKSYEQQVKEQRAREDTANALLAQVQIDVNKQRTVIVAALTGMNAILLDLLQQGEAFQAFEQDYRGALGDYIRQVESIPGAPALLARLKPGIKLGSDDPLNSSFIHIGGQARDIYPALYNPKFVLTVAEEQTRQSILKVIGARAVYQYGEQVNLAIRPGPVGSFHWEFASPADRDRWNSWVDRAVDNAAQMDTLVPPASVKDEYATVREQLKRLKVTGSNMSYPDKGMTTLHDLYRYLTRIVQDRTKDGRRFEALFNRLLVEISDPDQPVTRAYQDWVKLRDEIPTRIAGDLRDRILKLFKPVSDGFDGLLQKDYSEKVARREADESRRPLDHKKLLDMLIDQVEDKYIELLEGTRAHTANIDNYIKSVSTALDDDFQTQFYLPAFRGVRDASRYWDVNLGQIETTSILTNNRAFAKVSPQATMEFDLPKRDILIAEAMNGSMAMMQTYGALLQDPTFLALTKLNSGQPTSSPAQGFAGGLSVVRSPLPGLPSSSDERVLSQAGPGEKNLASPLEALIPDPAVYKFETGTGYEIRPVISPDGQSVVFHFNYMYSTNIREPVRADEKHLGRVKQHYIDTDVQLGNYELREISRYVVALKASRTSRGVPLLEDIPGLGILFRPLPSAESSLQENVIMGQAVVFPTLFDLMGLRWAPAVADLDPLRTRNQEFVTRMRLRDLMNHTYDYSASKVDEFLRVPPAERRTDLYRSQETVPYVHPDGYSGPGLNLKESHLQEGYDPLRLHPDTRFVPSESREGVPGYPPPPFGAFDDHPGFVVPPPIGPGVPPPLMILPPLDHHPVPPPGPVPVLPAPRPVPYGSPTSAAPRVAPVQARPGTTGLPALPRPAPERGLPAPPAFPALSPVDGPVLPPLDNRPVAR